MKQSIHPLIDVEKCTGCGKCVHECPCHALAIDTEHCRLCTDHCMHCGHCISICPHNAITVPAIHPPSLVYPRHSQKTTTLFEHITMRRSCRRFDPTPIDEAVLRDLVTFGQWAPSGTNSQTWTFTILTSRTHVHNLAVEIGHFYRRLNRYAANPLMRLFSRLFLKDILGKYYRQHYRQIDSSLKKWDADGTDLLFHGATAAIVIAMKPGASCPHDDALCAAQNILLGAHSMGVGSCLIGFAVEAMKRDRAILRHLKIPTDEIVYAVVALGNPNPHYLRPSGRKELVIRTM